MPRKQQNEGKEQLIVGSERSLPEAPVSFH
jgi:hypothetical protein